MQPGDESHVQLDFTMGPGMVGLHLFELEVTSNDPVEPDRNLYLKVDFVLEDLEGTDQ